jgi:hypothetical protein
MAGELTPERVLARQRAVQATDLRVSGHSFAEIAKRLDFANASSARKAVLRGIELLSPPPEAAFLRKIEMERLERVHCAATARLTAVGDDDKFAVDYLKLIIQASDARRKLCHLDGEVLIVSTGQSVVASMSNEELRAILDEPEAGSAQPKAAE